MDSQARYFFGPLFRLRDLLSGPERFPPMAAEARGAARRVALCSQHPKACTVLAETLPSREGRVFRSGNIPAASAPSAQCIERFRRPAGIGCGHETYGMVSLDANA